MEFSRGITPEILLDHVRNTIPYALNPQASLPETPYLRALQSQPKALNHFEYFKLCVSAHFATVSSFVPTDVDNQIRFKLWHPELSRTDLQPMWDLVAEAIHWDMTAISKRFVRGPTTRRVLSGMHGEWFSIAAGAYCAALRPQNGDPERVQQFSKLILDEMQREAEVLEELFRARNGIGLLQAATTIAHNLGDLDRVMDQWNLPADDSLRLAAYKAAVKAGTQPFSTALFLAGELNKASFPPRIATSMADENHRHFALRSARCLRKSPDFLLPISPFFDDWGSIIGRHPALSAEEVAEVVQCLMDGWEKLKPLQKTQAYPRALAGIESSFPGGLSRLCQYLPSRAAKTLRSGPLRTACSVPRSKFEEPWAQQALHFSASHFLGHSSSARLLPKRS